MLFVPSLRAAFFFPQQIGNAGNFFVRNSLFLHVLDLVFSEAAANLPLSSLRKSGSKSFFRRQKHCASFLEKQVSCLRNGGQEQFVKNAPGLHKFTFKNRPASTFPSQRKPFKGEFCAMWKKRDTRRPAFVAFWRAHPKNAFGNFASSSRQGKFCCDPAALFCIGDAIGNSKSASAKWWSQHARQKRRC